MTKLMKFVKPFTLLLIVAIGLLYLQVTAELALPDYMSDMVDVGIQESGFERAVFPVIEGDDFLDMQALLTDSEKDLWRLSYIEVNSMYELQDLDEASLSALEQSTVSIFAKMTNANEVDEATLMKMTLAGIVTYSESIGVDIESIQRTYILGVGGKMLLLALLGAVASIAVGFIAARVAAGMGRNLRKSVFEKVSKFSSYEMDRFTTASLITRSTNDITQIQNLMVMMIRMLFYAPLLGVGGILKALEKSTSMSWIIALAVLILLGLVILIFSITMPKFKAIQKMVDGLNRVVRENLTGMMVIRAFNTQAFEENRFDVANKELTQTNLFVNRIMVFLFPAMTVIMNGVTLIIVWIGAKQIDASAMQVGDMMAFMQYAIQIIMSFLMLSMMFIMVPRASVSAARIAEVLESEVQILDPIKPKDLKENGLGKLEFNQVSFKYPGAEEEVLKDISFTLEPGTFTGVIGSTGSGKSSLVKLIPRFYEFSSGEISIDGTSIQDLKLADLRAMIGYVPQRSLLFQGTIESNLKLGHKNVSTDLMDQAVRIAQAKDIVEASSDGMQTQVSQGGANLSGGQKQRLAIARAIAKKPKLYLFDDSFSALDFKTDSNLRHALKEELETATVLLVAQRVASIKNADQILVLDEGQLVGQGTHSLLMETCSVYREIALSQLNVEELS
ncbi:ABC transporter ATP-binding protein [Fusibacter tunisiensis]|uniref:ATP-binding cassette subfamily B protein n=1 Tax=Fusibacter tunisiensis TaxID=1008308 RepID=A0ABS2MRR6_9FIRM|nr:ABC transporter ATP-binding protein [Fusibacter tunisiensis]MBM7562084.1 ATP-binding cassette subfamily B protein [Fusibacter tunisiensis]